MTQDEIIEMARIAGANSHFVKHHIAYIEAFASLIAARERRECAKLAAEVGYWGLVHEIEARGEQA